MFQENKLKDFSQVLNALLESDVPVAGTTPPGPATPAAPNKYPKAVDYPPAAPPERPKPEGEQSKRGIVKMLNAVRSKINKDIAMFEQSLTTLHEQVVLKMREFTTAAASAGSASAASAATIASLRERITELQTDYATKAQQVDDILEKVKILLPTLGSDRASGLSAAQEIGQKLTTIKQEMQDKARDIETMMGDLATAHHGAAQSDIDMEEVERQLTAFDDYSAQVEAELKEARVQLKRLERGKATHGGTHNYDSDLVDKFSPSKKKAAGAATAADSAEEASKPYGNFDFMEHLRRAKANTKKNASDW